MPSKSQRGRSKRLSQSKKRRERQSSSARVAQQTTAQTSKPVSHSGVSTPSASAPARVVTVTAARYPYIVTELRRIGILAGIMLIILVVLALVLS